jgi:hypothetical protein
MKPLGASKISFETKLNLSIFNLVHFLFWLILYSGNYLQFQQHFLGDRKIDNCALEII